MFFILNQVNDACDLSYVHVTCPTRVKKAATTDGFPWIDSPTLSPSDILEEKIQMAWLLVMCTDKLPN